MKLAEALRDAYAREDALQVKLSEALQWLDEIRSGTLDGSESGLLSFIRSTDHLMES